MKDVKMEKLFAIICFGLSLALIASCGKKAINQAQFVAPKKEESKVLESQKPSTQDFSIEFSYIVSSDKLKDQKEFDYLSKSFSENEIEVNRYLNTKKLIVTRLNDLKGELILKCTPDQKNWFEKKLDNRNLELVMVIPSEPKMESESTFCRLTYNGKNEELEFFHQKRLYINTLIKKPEDLLYLSQNTFEFLILDQNAEIVTSGMNLTFKPKYFISENAKIRTFSEKDSFVKKEENVEALSGGQIEVHAMEVFGQLNVLLYGQNAGTQFLRPEPKTTFFPVTPDMHARPIVRKMTRECVHVFVKESRGDHCWNVNAIVDQGQPAINGRDGVLGDVGFKGKKGGDSGRLLVLAEFFSLEVNLETLSGIGGEGGEGGIGGPGQDGGNGAEGHGKGSHGNTGATGPRGPKGDDGVKLESCFFNKISLQQKCSVKKL